MVGAGPLADELAYALATMGARVAVTAADADALLGFARRGHDTRPVGAVGVRIPAETDIVFATGEELSALTPASIETSDPDAGIPAHPVVIVDAAPPGKNPAVDLTTFAAHPVVPARDQIRGFTLSREVFVLTISEVAVGATVDSALSAVCA